MDPKKEVTPQIEAEIEAEARWAMQYAEAIKYHAFLARYVIDATHPGAHRAAAFAYALSKPGILKLIDVSTGVELGSGPLSATNPIVEERVVTLFEHLATVQVKTKTLIIENRELTLEDVENLGKAFLAVTRGKVEAEPFTFICSPTADYNESKVIGLAPGQFVLATDKPDVLPILDTTISLAPWGIVAEKAVLRLEKTDVATSSAPLGRKHIRVEPAEGTTIFANYPLYSEVRFARNDST
jgi:hypothetical protein